MMIMLCYVHRILRDPIASCALIYFDFGAVWITCLLTCTWTCALGERNCENWRDYIHHEKNSEPREWLTRMTSSSDCVHWGCLVLLREWVSVVYRETLQQPVSCAETMSDWAAEERGCVVIGDQRWWARPVTWWVNSVIVYSQEGHPSFPQIFLPGI